MERMYFVKNAYFLLFMFSWLSCSVAGTKYVFYGRASALPFLFSESDMDKICSFFGHRDVFVDLSDELKSAVEKAITEFGITTFYVGENGDFDRMAAGAVRSIKRRYPNIKLILVLPYFTNRINEYKEIYESDFDSIYIPSELADVHPKGAITKRNKIMVDESDLVICYITREHGGAFNAAKYSKKKNIPTINIGDTKDFKNFDMRAYAKYVRENNVNYKDITPEIWEKFYINKK